MRNRSLRVTQAGKFVTVEGIEGSGKSTLLAGLAGWLAKQGIDHMVTREPGGTPLGDRLRALFKEPGLEFDALTEAFVVNASRAQLVAEVIEPALAAGRFVLCDRFFDATLAYQGFGRGLDLATLDALVKIATRGREPDLTFLVDVPVEVSRERVASRALELGEAIDRVERESDDFHERVRAGYLQLARRSARIVTFDGTETPAVLLDRAVGQVKALLA